MEHSPLLRRQHGIYTVRQARELGLRRDEHGGYPGSRILPGVWSLLPPPYPPVAERHAAVLYAGRDARLTGRAAATHLGWRAGWPGEPVKVAIPTERNRADKAFVSIARTSVDPGLMLRDLPLAEATRVLVDAGGELPQRSLTAITAKALQRREVRFDDLVMLVTLHPRLPGARALRVTLAALASGAESVKEVDCLGAFRRMRLPAPELGVSIFDGQILVSKPDFWWLGVAGFYDGATHLDAEDHESDLIKRTRLETMGIEVVPITKRLLDEETLLRNRLLVALRVAGGRTGPPAWRIESAR